MGTDMTNTNPARKPFDVRHGLIGAAIWSDPTDNAVLIGEVYDKGPGSFDHMEMAKVWAAACPVMFPALANIRNVARRAAETDRYETKEALLTLLAAIGKVAGDALPVPTIGDLSGAAPTAPEAAVPALRECPCCAGPAYPGTVRYNPATVRENGWSQDTFHSVSCAVCGLEMSGIVGFQTPEAAAEAWNRREAELPALKASMEVLTARPDCSHLHPEGGRFSFAYSPNTELPWVGWRFDDRELAHAARVALEKAMGSAPATPPAPASIYDPLRRIDYPEGRFGPAMLGGDDEMNAKELKLIAKSHGFDLRLKVEEWDDDLRDMVIDDTFGAALEAACPPQVDKDGYQLVGAWDSEEGELVLAYVRPLEGAVDGGAQS